MGPVESHEFEMAENNGFIGAGILAGLAGLMASESTGVKAPPAAP